MGAWGTGLYSDDTALDVKSDLLEALEAGMDCHAAFEKLKAFYLDSMDEDDPDIPVFWMVCADVLWRKGMLNENIKQIALSYLENGGDSARWNDESPTLGRKRRAVCERLEKRLRSPQPKPKPIRAPKYYICPWKVGDVFAMPLHCEEAKIKNLKGTYLLFQVAELIVSPRSDHQTDGDKIPIVYAQFSMSKSTPDLDDYDGTSIIQVMQECPATNQKKVHVIEIASRSDHDVPQNLIFLGNKEVHIPSDDYGIHHDGNSRYMRWCTTFKNLETVCLECYFEYNVK